MNPILLGIAGDRWAKTQALVKANPAHATRILGLPIWTEVAPQTHRIEVNCATGERTVVTTPADTPHPFPPSELRLTMIAAVEDMAREKAHKHVMEETVPTGPTIKAILAAVTAASGVRAYDICGGPSSERLQSVVYARHLYCYLMACLRRDMSYPAMARTFLCHRHHTTVMNAALTFHRKRLIPEVMDMCAHPAVVPMVMLADANPRLIERRRIAGRFKGPNKPTTTRRVRKAPSQPRRGSAICRPAARRYISKGSMKHAT